MVATLLIVLACVLAPLSAVAVWTRNQVTNTDRYVETVSPLADDPAIQAAITDQIPPMVACGLGIGFVPDFMLESLPKELHVRPIQLDEPIPPRHISLVQECDRTLSTAAMRLMHYLTKKEAAADERP